jgi:integrase
LAFTVVTGARDSAIASMKLKHLDLIENRVYQDAREVNTKFSKTFHTYFFPVEDEIRAIVVDWVGYLREKLLWGNDDPIFPATRVTLGETREFEASGLKREHWSSASPIRSIFRDAFLSAGLPYFNPHSFRATLVQLGEEVCKSPEEFKAWSQNLGHEKVLTTFTSYGTVACQRQGESCGIWPQDNDQSNQMQMKSQKCCLGNSATLVWKYRLNEKLQSRAGSGALTPVRIFGKERLKLIPF